MKISSLQNPKVKFIRKLRDKRGRDQEQRFVIDYQRDLLRAIDLGYEVDYTVFCPDIANQDDNELLARIDSDKIYEVPQSIMEKVSYRQNPSAWIAVIKSKDIYRSIDAIPHRENSLVLGLVNLQKPGNIGALLRTADATGFNAILLIDVTLDIYNPNIIRSSTGACFLDNIYMVNSTDAMRFLHSSGYSIAAAVVDGDRTLFDTDFRGKTAIILGSEDQGLSDFWIQTADQKVQIPMLGSTTDSLNVSVSGAIFMYEAVRQRI